jgi:hypothetical protein
LHENRAGVEALTNPELAMRHAKRAIEIFTAINSPEVQTVKAMVAKNPILARQPLPARSGFD